MSTGHQPTPQPIARPPGRSASGRWCVVVLLRVALAMAVGSASTPSAIAQTGTARSPESPELAPRRLAQSSSSAAEPSSSSDSADETAVESIEVESQAETTLEQRQEGEGDEESSDKGDVTEIRVERVEGSPNEDEEDDERREVEVEDSSSASERRAAGEREFGRRTSPTELDENELEAQGWEVSDEVFRPGDAWGGLLALTGGLVVHGAGHFFVRDVDYGVRLLASELIALTAFTVGTLLTTRVGDRSDGAYYTGAALQVAGGGLFFWGYLGDVIGTFKSTTVRLPSATDRPMGFSGQLLYSSVFGSTVAIGSIGELDLAWLSERLEVELHTEYAPVPGFYGVLLRAGYRLPVGKLPRTALVVEGVFGEEAARGHGWGRDRVAAGVHVTVDMGEILPHVQGLLWKLRVLGWTDFYFYETEGWRRLRAANLKWHVPIETGIGMNVNQGIYIETGYRHRSDLLIGGLFESGGAFYQRFSILPIDAFGIEAEIEEGEYFRLHVGIRWQLSTNEE